MMQQISGGSYQIGTKDGKVYLDRTDENGDVVFSCTMPPTEARQIGQALIDKANEIDWPDARDTSWSAHSKSAPATWPGP